MTSRASRVLAGVACAAVAGLAVQCGSPSKPAAPAPGMARTPAVVAARDPAAAAAAWQVIYGVLQHPRCANCHPAGDRPLQGDDSHVHLQNVQRGSEGHGVGAMRCDTCHQTRNLDGPHMPPGAPEWHLPAPDMPLVFVGRSSRELCEQMRDPAHNGGKTPEQLIEHMETPLVLWGWAPGEGRERVPTSHEELMRAMRTWVDAGCGCPGE